MQSAITRQEIARQVIDTRALKVETRLYADLIGVGDEEEEGEEEREETETIHDSNENCFLSRAGG
jgi:hypothetical protein